MFAQNNIIKCVLLNENLGQIQFPLPNSLVYSTKFSKNILINKIYCQEFMVISETLKQSSEILTIVFCYFFKYLYFECFLELFINDVVGPFFTTMY